MNYTIAKFDEVQGRLTVDISKSGNEYEVSIWDKEEKASTIKTFSDLQDAYKVFEKLVSWCVFGYYTDKQRKEFLLTGTME